MVQLKRAYVEPEASDGTRVLVDRLWPRGVSHERAQLDLWLKEIAPSRELREWFAHDPAKFDVFRRRYLAELAAAPEAQSALTRLRELAARGPLTLVYAAHDETHNEAIALRDLLNGAGATEQGAPTNPAPTT
jgi:uncharacterized protein YeaO (DUF488 family)